MVMLSPGVKTRENDFTTYVAQVSSSILGLVGGATKGEINKPILCTSPNDFKRKLGTPHPDSLATYSGMNFLREGNMMYFVRVTDGTEAIATVTLEDGETEPATITFDAATPGTWANDYKILVEPYDKDLEELKITLLDESKNELTNWIVSLDPENDNFIEDEFEEDDWLAVTYDPDDNFIYPELEEIITMSGGLNGMDDLSEMVDTEMDYSSVIGSSTSEGLQIFRNVEAIDVNILACPDFSYSGAIANELIDIAESRGDCLSLVDPPIGLSTQEVVDWHNGGLEGEGYPEASLNTSYGATYWSWTKHSDPYNGGSIWLPPSAEVAATFAYNDRVAHPWFAPAGHRRGGLSRPLAIEHSPSSGERNLLYGNKNAINPMVNFSTDGITIWGQRTLQRKPSATDRINVRRLLLMIRKSIAASTQYFVFQPNDFFTWNEWKSMIRPYLKNLQDARALTDFEVVMDESTVTPQDIDQNKMPGQVLVKPTRAAEFITIDFNLVPTGAEFSEYVQ